MDVNLILFSERLKRVLAGEEGTSLLPDSTSLKPYFLNILIEIDIITSLLGNYEGDMARILFLLWGKLCSEEVDRQDIICIVKDINYFVHESEKAIDSFFISSGTISSKEFYDDLQHLQSKIIGIRNRMQQLPPSQENADLREIRDSFIQTEASDSSSSSCSGYEKKHMETLLDFLIEGEPQLSVVAIIDSSGFNTFAAEAYNSNHAKYYFDCRIWVRVSIAYNYSTILDAIMKSVMPPSEFSEIIGKDYALKKTIVHNYLKCKKYLIVLDDVGNGYIWTFLRDALPDYQNGSRVLMTVTNIKGLNLFQLEHEENIEFDSGPLIPIANALWPCFLLYYGSKTLDAIMEEIVHQPTRLTFFCVLELPFNLKVCSLYLSVFLEPYEICTRQLYQLWIAEGLIPNNSEETAEEYLKELIRRGLIKVEKKRAGGTIKTCSFSSNVLSALLLITEHIHFSRISEVNLVEGCTAKRISIFGNLTEFVSMEHSNTYLHSVLCFRSESNHHVIIDCMEICKKFKYLRVLNLGSLVLDQYPSGIENLFYLKYLKLIIPNLKSLPSSLCNLLNLYTLDMPSSYIDHTPEDIWKMDKLMHLNFGYIILPAHPGKYSSSLKNLRFISALHSRSCTADILARLPNVQTLRIFGDLSYYQSEMSKSLCELLKLEYLKLVNENKTWHLSQMVLAEYQFPPGLTHLSLSNTKLKDDPMPALEKLPHLQVLKLKQNSYLGRKLACVGSGSFPQLKILHLKSMLWLEEWTVGARALPKLESLIINPCAYLRRLPEELWRIDSFRKLELHWPQPELRKSLRVFEDMEWYDIQKYPYGI